MYPSYYIKYETEKFDSCIEGNSKRVARFLAPEEIVAIARKFEASILHPVLVAERINVYRGHRAIRHRHHRVTGSSRCCVLRCSCNRSIPISGGSLARTHAGGGPALLEVPLGPQLIEEVGPLRPRVAGGYSRLGRVGGDIDNRGDRGAEAEGVERARVAAGSGGEEVAGSEAAGAEEIGAQSELWEAGGGGSHGGRVAAAVKIKRTCRGMGGED